MAKLSGIATLVVAACCLRAMPGTIQPGTLYERIAPGVVKLEMNRALAGTGWVWDRHHVITAAHVVNSEREVGVVTHDGARCEVVAVAMDPDTDVAVVEVQGCKLRPLAPADAPPTAGEAVWSLGHIAGMTYSLTRGVVSAPNRRVEGVSMVQFDAPINPGSSGGPLLNDACEVIGMSVQLRSPTRVWAGIGLAVRIDEIRDSVAALMDEIDESKVSLPLGPHKQSMLTLGATP